MVAPTPPPLRTRTSSRNEESRLTTRFFLLSFPIPSRTNTYLDRSDYDDPSTTTLRSFSFDLWITDNRIRWTRRSSYSMINRAPPSPPPFHPAFFFFLSFFHPNPPNFHLLRDSRSVESLRTMIKRRSNANRNCFNSCFLVFQSRSIASRSILSHGPWKLSRYRSKTLNRGLSSRLKLVPRPLPPSNSNHRIAPQPRFSLFLREIKPNNGRRTVMLLRKKGAKRSSIPVPILSVVIKSVLSESTNRAESRFRDSVEFFWNKFKVAWQHFILVIY